MILNLQKRVNNCKMWGRIAIVLLVGLTAFIVSRYYVQLMLIQGSSMLPIYKSGQIVLLDKQNIVPERGDVIAFKSNTIDGIIVKRVIGLPGEKITIKQGKIYIDDYLREEYPYIDYPGIAGETVELRSEEYFVLGDNVAESVDSRYPEIGPVNQKSIVGKVLNIGVK